VLVFGGLRCQPMALERRSRGGGVGGKWECPVRRLRLFYSSMITMDVRATSAVREQVQHHGTVRTTYYWR